MRVEPFHPDFLSPDISHALIVLAASILSVPLHVFDNPTHTYLFYRSPSPLPITLAALLVPTHSHIQTAIVSSLHHYSLDIGHGLTSVSVSFLISRVPQDLLLPVAESFVHASANICSMEYGLTRSATFRMPPIWHLTTWQSQWAYSRVS
jgi:hypothetical protein